jgi:hypothetical protein
MAQVALAIVVALAVVLAVVLSVLGVEALSPATYDVSGTVMEQGFLREVPAVGATVVMTVNGGAPVRTVTAADGSFSFHNVAAGGISVNITQASYAPVTVDTFASPVYGTGTTGLSVVLVPGNESNATTQTLSPFPDLETFVASVGSAVALLGIVAILGGWAAVVTGRSDRPAVGVVGGAAGILAPAALYVLSLGGVFPYLIVGFGALAAVGTFAATTRCLEIYQVGSESRVA